MKMLSRQEEKELLRSGEDVFRSDFPNPERLGCPGAEILKTLASRSQSLTLTDRSRYLDHMTCCSPCFNEFSAFVDQARHRKRLAVVGLCAVLLLTLGLTAWLAMSRWGSKPTDPITQKPPSTQPERRPQEEKTPEPWPQEQRPEIARQQPEPKIYKDVVLDVRDQSVARGEAPQPRDKYPTIPTGLLNLSIYLPFGSEPGKYHLTIYRDPAKPLLITTGTARIRRGITIVQLKVDTSQMPRDSYVLESRSESWASSYKYKFMIAPGS
ncbi:MAG: hypothetical protein ACRD2L_05660 [Terriglobia bacterium]